jgi:predicted AAA+ superfamily ATPase
MKSKNNVLFRYAQDMLKRHEERQESLLVLGPRQVGKTTLVKTSLPAHSTMFNLADPSVRLDFERDPALLV